MAILSKGCKPDKFEPHNSLKASFKNIRGLCSNFIECESFLESNSPDILALYFVYWSPPSLLCTVFDLISSNIDEILSINPSANVFVFGSFNIHHKDWLTYFGGTGRPGELCYNFPISNDLIQILTQFPLTFQ